MAIQDDYIKTAFRLPQELHAELLASAEKKGRSMNAEIIGRLEQSFDLPNVLEMSQEKLKLSEELVSAHQNAVGMIGLLAQAIAIIGSMPVTERTAAFMNESFEGIEKLKAYYFPRGIARSEGRAPDTKPSVKRVTRTRPTKK